MVAVFGETRERYENAGVKAPSSNTFCGVTLSEDDIFFNDFVFRVELRRDVVVEECLPALDLI